MKHFRIITVPVLIMFFFVLAGLNPLSADAELTPLSDSQLKSVRGQGGFALDIPGFDLQRQGDSWYYHDSDGVDGSPGAYITFSDVVFDGSIIWSFPPDTLPDGNAVPARNLAGFDLQPFSMSANIDEFSIGAIQVGDAPERGASFGAFAMNGLTMEATGFIGIQNRR